MDVLDHEGKLVVAGGYNVDVDPEQSVEILDLESETWSNGNAIPGSLEYLKFHRVEHIWFGLGYDNKGNLEAIYQYNSNIGVWDDVTPNSKGFMSAIDYDYLPLDVDDLKICQDILH